MIFYCIICGVSACNLHGVVDSGEVEKPADEPWAFQYRFLYPSHCNPKLVEAGDLATYQCTPGRLRHDFQNNITDSIAVWDEEPKNHAFLNSQLPEQRRGYAMTRDDPTNTLPLCFPIHQVCWDIFRVILEKCGIQLNPSRVLEMLHRLAEGACYNTGLILWPNGFQEDKIRQYWRLRPDYPMDSRLPEEIAYLEAEPSETACTKALGLLKQESGTADIPTTQRSTQSTIPEVFPLPSELIDKVLSYLSMEDLISLQQIPSVKRVRISAHVWKTLFSHRGEFGYLENCFTGPDDWQQRALLSYKFRNLGDEPDVLRNRNRIWNLCLTLVDLISEMEPSHEINLSEYTPSMIFEEVFDPQGFIIRALRHDLRLQNPKQLIDFSLSRGRLTDFTTSGIRVSYIGSGLMRFVSGLTFLPGGQSIGHINLQDQRYVSFRSENGGSELVLWIAACRFGIRDITATENLHTYPKWPGNCDFNDVAVTRRSFMMKEGRIDIKELYVGVEIPKIIELGIWSDDTININSLDRQESFIQRNMWNPTLLPVLVTPGFDISKWYGFQAYDTLTLGKTNFYPMNGIYFGTETVTRFTCWTHERYDICAIEVATRERADSPYIIGHIFKDSTVLMSSIDILLDWEDGETIVAFEIIKATSNGKLLTLESINTADEETGLSHKRHPHDGPVLGFELRTSHGRRFRHNMHSASGDQLPGGYITGISLGPSSGERLEGFYGRFYDLIYRRGEEVCRPLESIGCINRPTQTPTAPEYSFSSSACVNPQLRSRASVYDKPERFQMAFCYESHIGFSNINSITPCYRRLKHFNILRIVGFLFTYTNKEGKKGPHRRLWGQIGGTETGPTSPIKLDSGEVVRFVVIYQREGPSLTAIDRYSPRHIGSEAVVGMKLQTSHGKDVLIGTDSLDGGVTEISFQITDKTLLGWGYNRQDDSFCDKDIENVEIFV